MKRERKKEGFEKGWRCLGKGERGGEAGEERRRQRKKENDRERNGSGRRMRKICR